VIIILGILAAIVVFALGNTRKDSVVSSCKTNYKSIELSAEAVNTKMGSYPRTLAPSYLLLVAGNRAGPGLTNNGALLKTYPTSSDYSIVYLQTGAGRSFALTVKGPRD